MNNPDNNQRITRSFLYISGVCIFFSFFSLLTEDIGLSLFFLVSAFVCMAVSHCMSFRPVKEVTDTHINQESLKQKHKMVQTVFTAQELRLIQKCVRESINYAEVDYLDHKLNLISKCDTLLNEENFKY